MQGGELRHIISILQAPIISGPAGNQEDWDNPIVVCYQYASIKPASASDVIRAGQTVTQVETPIEIRYYPGITLKCPDSIVDRNIVRIEDPR